MSEIIGGLNFKIMANLKKNGEEKKSGGKREGSGNPRRVTRKNKTFSIDLDLIEYLKTQVGNQNDFVNMTIRAYKEQSELIIGKIDKLLS